MHCFQSSEHIGGTSGGEELREGIVVENPGPVNDSDTGVTEAEVKDGRGKKKTERKRKRTHLGPRIKVYSGYVFMSSSILLQGAKNSDRGGELGARPGGGSGAG